MQLMMISRKEVIGSDDYRIDFLVELFRRSCSCENYHESE